MLSIGVHPWFWRKPPRPDQQPPRIPRAPLHNPLDSSPF
jgi:hypothetical protein